ncbi:hypothetical protein [Rhizobium sp. Leaf383]|uniref:hypothetical protein n=1 Tax=Rhizobium sp. Leaf383 TaxID=1736357 RepID=UPI0007127827|nr:hypothetical protein [Rhizobium sp. Leaf383]KQS84255.1 hypothetical protein ASG58_21025 [Rhizobium sp. Leaf383]
MRNSFISQIIAATIPGTILLALSFYFFTTSPRDVSSDIDIEYYQSNIATAAFKEALTRLTPALDFTEPSTFQKINKDFIIGDSVSLSIYKIKNDGPNLVPDIKVVMGRNIYAYVEDQKNFRFIDPSITDATVSVLPRGAATLVVINSYDSVYPAEKFILGGTELPVFSIRDSLLDPFGITDFSIQHPIIIYMLVLISVIAIFFAVWALTAEIFMGRNLAFIASVTDNKQIARLLATLTHVHEEEPERYKAIVGRAERQYQKWVSRNKSNAA